MTGAAGITAGRQAIPCEHISGGAYIKNPVKHVLADGRELEDIEGFVIPMTGQAAAVYRIVPEIYRRIVKDDE